MDDTKNSVIFPALKLDDFRPDVPPKTFPAGHTAQVTSLLEHLQGKCAARNGLIRALERPATPKDLATPEACADWIMESLWLEGFIITPTTNVTDDEAG